MGLSTNTAMDLIIITGLSGAGRTSATRALEDIGWFVIDNMPPQLFTQVVETLLAQGRNKLVLTMGLRGEEYREDLAATISDLKQQHLADVRVLYLEASDEILVRRFDSSRRPHPLQADGSMADAVRHERILMRPLRPMADLVIDTTQLNEHELRRKVHAAFPHEDDRIKLRATVMSFGFKYGIPIDADYVADVRFLPNPHWVPELRPLSGQDAPVNDYVVNQPRAREFLNIYSDLINLVADGYLEEGKRYVTLAVGCTGGRHRSVAMAENLAARLVKEGVETLVLHRDLGRE